jgi:hypothetical protein
MTGRLSFLSFLSLSLAICAMGCVQRDRLNSDCKWVLDPALPLNLSDPSQQRHVVEDVIHAEELGVRYADARIRRGYGQPVREQCIASLLQVIASNHQIQLKDVVAARGRRDPRWDVAVVLGFAIFYAFAAQRLVKWLFDRFDGLTTIGIAVVAASLPTSAVGVVLGELWSHLMESARFGWTGHMTRERGIRIPWQYHRLAFFIAGIALAWLTAILMGFSHHRKSIRPAGPRRNRDSLGLSKT